MTFNKSLNELAGIPTTILPVAPAVGTPAVAPAVGTPAVAPTQQSIADIPEPPVAPVDTKKATDAAEGKVNKIQFERVAKEVVRKINKSSGMEKTGEKIRIFKTPTALRLKYGGTTTEIKFKNMFEK